MGFCDIAPNSVAWSKNECEKLPENNISYSRYLYVIQ